jgi:hypothetical protein
MLLNDEKTIFDKCIPQNKRSKQIELKKKLHRKHIYYSKKR